MAITSLDAIINAIGSGKSIKTFFQKASSNAATSAAGRFHELFTANGIPAAGAFSGTAGVATQMTSATQGALPIQAVASPDSQHLLNMSLVSPTATGVTARLILVDFLLYYPALVVTGTPTVLNNTATLPRYADGAGVKAFIAVQTALGATQPALTFTYVDQNGTGSNVAPAMTSPAASAPISTCFQNSGGLFMPMVGTDTGIRSLTSYTLATGTTGTVAAVLCKPLAEIPITVVNSMVQVDYLAQIPSLPKIEDGACLGFVMLAGGAMVAAASFQGSIETVWG